MPDENITIGDEERQRIMEKQQNVEAMVTELLRDDERCRNQDLWLILSVWVKMQHIRLFVPFDKLGMMIPPESITRARRTVQNTKNIYLPTDPRTLLKRRFKQEVLRGYYGEQSAIYTEWQKEAFGVKEAKQQ